MTSVEERRAIANTLRERQEFTFYYDDKVLLITWEDLGRIVLGTDAIQKLSKLKNKDNIAKFVRVQIAGRLAELIYPLDENQPSTERVS